MAGRVGDSPIIGSGVYCDNSKGGVSTTGHGESIMKVCLAKSAIDIMSDPTTNIPSQEALRIALAHMKERLGGCGGMISISPEGVIGKAFSTPRMSWASIEAFQENTKVSRYSGIDPDEKNAWI